MTFFGGMVLAATACFGFLISFGRTFEGGGNEVLSGVTALLFLAGLVLVLAGFVLLITRGIRAMMEKNSGAS